jgi:hypothetical protein
MTASIANEPYAAIKTQLAAQTALATAVAGRLTQDWPDQVLSFPLLVWRVIGDAPGPTDSDRENYKDQTVEVNVFGPDKDQLTDLAALVDAAFNDSMLGGVMDTTHWRITLMHRQTAWQKQPYQQRQGATGKQLWQITADFRFKALRKQNVD